MSTFLDLRETVYEEQLHAAVDWVQLNFVEGKRVCHFGEQQKPEAILDVWLQMTDGEELDLLYLDHKFPKDGNLSVHSPNASTATTVEMADSVGVRSPGHAAIRRRFLHPNGPAGQILIEVQHTYRSLDWKINLRLFQSSKP